jgi:endoglucanase
MDIELLKNICETPGVPGYEKAVRSLVLAEVEHLVDHVWVDNIGNVFALKKGVRNPENKKVMVAAHMDEIGFIVRFITKEGFIYVQPLEFLFFTFYSSNLIYLEFKYPQT